MVFKKPLDNSQKKQRQQGVPKAKILAPSSFVAEWQGSLAMAASLFVLMFFLRHLPLDTNKNRLHRQTCPDLSVPGRIILAFAHHCMN